MGLLRRAIVKSEPGSGGVRQGRRVYGRNDEGDQAEENEGVLREVRAKAERLVGLEIGKEGSGLWCWQGGSEEGSDGKEEVKKVGEWLVEALH